MDQYEQIRSLSFPALASALGINLERFKTRKGGEFYGPCPVHQPKNNSTSFSYAADGKFFCFSCQAKGRGGIDLTMAVKAIGFQQATEFLAPHATTTPAKEKPAQRTDSEATGELKPLEKDSWSKFKVPCPWLEERIPDTAVRDAYGVYCYNNPARKSAYSGRVMIPIKDVEGILYGYLGRAIQDNQEAKYLFPKDFPKSRFLFGAFELAQGLYLPAVRQGAANTNGLPLKVVYLLESPFAVLKFASLGLPAVSPFGWSVSDEQLSLLTKLTKGIVYLPDKNKRHECGNVLLAATERVWLRFPPLPDGIDDPEQLSLEEIQSLTH